MRLLPLLLSWIVLGWAAAGVAAGPQPPPREAAPIVVRFAELKIPFKYKAANDQEKPVEVHLHVSKDRGNTWETAQKTTPDAKHFVYRAAKDGEYWFMLRTKCESGKYLPSGPARAEVKVIVDTMPPALELEATRGEAGDVHVRWNLSDANLAPETFKIEYQVAGDNQNWQRIAVEPPSSEALGKPHEGEISFLPEGRPDLGAVTVRAEAADRANNPTVVERAVTLPNEDQTAEGDKLAAEQPDRAQPDLGQPGQRRPADADQSMPGPKMNHDEGAATAPPDMAENFPGNFPAGRKSFPVTEAETPYPRTESADWPAAPPADRPANQPPQHVDAQRPRGPAPTVREPVHPPVAGRYKGNSDAPANPAEKEEPFRASALPPGVRPHMVNKQRFELLYDVESIGTAGIAQVELWGTRDGGQTWSSFGVDEDGRSPMLVNVDGEGLYGFRVVVTTDAGVEGAVPASGELPDVWVGVDLTKPIGNLVSAEQGSGEEAGEMVISWEAGDERLAARPVSLRMSETPDGPWHTVASGLENTGRYVWRIDQRVPPKVYLRLEVRDEAGNVRIDDSTEPVEVQRVRPQGHIRDVRPLGEASRRSRTTHNLLK